MSYYSSSSSSHFSYVNSQAGGMTLDSQEESALQYGTRNIAQQGLFDSREHQELIESAQKQDEDSVAGEDVLTVGIHPSKNSSMAGLESGSVSVTGLGKYDESSQTQHQLDQESSKQHEQFSRSGLEEERENKKRKQLEFMQIVQQNVGFKNVVWRKSGFSILQKIILFSKRLLSKSMTKKFRNLQRRQFDIIDDKSAFFDVYKFNLAFDGETPTFYERIVFSYRNWITVKRNRLQEHIKNGCLGNTIAKLFRIIEIEDTIIRPDSTFKILWDIFLMIMVLINVFYIPLKLAFDFDSDGDSSQEYFLVGQGAQLVFLLDVALNFNTAFFKQGVLINSRIAIVKRYGRLKVWRDLLMIMPYFLSSQDNWKFLQAIFIFRVYLIRNIVHRLEEVFHPRNSGAVVIDIARVIFLLSFIAHLAGCSFYLLATSENVTPTWVSLLNTPASDWFSLYISGLYFSVITMITLGYGDIVPVTTKEKIFVICMTLVSSAVFAYSVNTISGIIGDMSLRKKQFQSKMMNLNRHIQKRGLNKQLAMRVRKYIEYLYKEELVSNESAERDLEQIPQSLKEDVYCDIYGKLLRSNKVFNLNFSSQFLDRLALRLKEKRYGPEEVIFKLGDQDLMLFFLTKGEVELFYPIKDPSNAECLKISHIYKGDTFGFYSFFTGKNREISARSMRVSCLITLQFKDFYDTAMDFPKDYETFCMLRDQANFNEITKGLDVKCNSCMSFSHQLEYCPFIKYQPQKNILIEKYNKSFPVERQSHNRRLIKSPNSRFLLKFIFKEEIFLILGVDKTDSEIAQNQKEEEDEQNAELEEQQHQEEKRPSQLAYEEKLFSSTINRVDSFASNTKKKVLQFNKMSTRLPSQFAFVQPQLSKTLGNQTDPLAVEFNTVEMDNFKIFEKYFVKNNIDLVLKQLSSIQQVLKANKHKKHLLSMASKHREKVNLSKVRIKSVLEKHQVGGGSPKKKPDNTQRKIAIKEQLRKLSEGRSDYLGESFESPNDNGFNDLFSLRRVSAISSIKTSQNMFNLKQYLKENNGETLPAIQDSEKSLNFVSQLKRNGSSSKELNQREKDHENQTAGNIIPSLNSISDPCKSTSHPQKYGIRIVSETSPRPQIMSTACSSLKPSDNSEKIQKPKKIQGQSHTVNSIFTQEEKTSPRYYQAEIMHETITLGPSDSQRGEKQFVNQI